MLRPMVCGEAMTTAEVILELTLPQRPEAMWPTHHHHTTVHRERCRGPLMMHTAMPVPDFQADMVKPMVSGEVRIIAEVILKSMLPR